METWVLVIVVWMSPSFSHSGGSGALAITNVPGYASWDECNRAAGTVSKSGGETKGYCVPGPKTIVVKPKGK
jgi:hypothetical protein